MSKHWNPKHSRWNSQWSWQRRPVPRRRRRSAPISWGELRLMVLGGAAVGLFSVLYPSSPIDLVRQGGSDPFSSGSGILITDAWAARIIDGDTFDYRGDRIRIADINTPEMNGRCARESRLAAQAKARMEGLLHAGPFEMQGIGRDEDRYGRKLRIVTRGGQSLGDQLVAEGLARTWTGRREGWC